MLLVALVAGALVGPAAVALAEGSGYGARWGYEGEFGPEHWGDMSVEFDACKTGTRQSPVDISSVVVRDLPDITVNYQDSPLQIVDDGHTIQVNYAAGSSIVVGDRTYELIQFHFHSPGEHTIGGKRYPMAVHLVHKSTDGKLGIIGVMMKEGKSNPLIDTLWTMLPTRKGMEKTVETTRISALELLPGNRTYFSYSGSLTTPPCSEDVNWMLLAAPIEVSAAQIEKFAGRYAGNNRPVQPLYRRAVSLDN